MNNKFKGIVQTNQMINKNDIYINNKSNLGWELFL